MVFFVHTQITFLINIISEVHISDNTFCNLHRINSDWLYTVRTALPGFVMAARKPAGDRRFIWPFSCHMKNQKRRQATNMKPTGVLRRQPPPLLQSPQLWAGWAPRHPHQFGATLTSIRSRMCSSITDCRWQSLIIENLSVIQYPRICTGRIEAMEGDLEVTGTVIHSKTKQADIRETQYY